MLFKNYNYRKTLERANRHYAAGEFSETIQLLLKAVNIKSDNASVFAVLSDCYTGIGYHEDALTQIRSALHLDPTNFDFLYQEILVLARGSNKDDALLKISKLPPPFIRAEKIQTIKAFTLFEMNRFGDAIKIFEELLNKYPDRVDYLLSIGDCYKKMGNDRKWLEYTELAVSADENNPYAKNNLGYILIKFQQYDRAILILKEALAIEPNFAYSNNNLGYAYLKTGKKELAFELITKSIELDGNNPYGYKNLAKFYIEEYEFDLAILNLERAKELGYKKLYGDEVDELLMKINKSR